MAPITAGRWAKGSCVGLGFMGSEEEGGGEQDSDADPQDLSLLFEHVVLLIEVVGQFDGSGEDFVLAAVGSDVCHGESGG